MKNDSDISVPVPVVKISNVKNLPNGEVEFEVEYGQDFIDAFKEDYPNKRATKGNIKKYLLALIDKHLQEKDEN